MLETGYHSTADIVSSSKKAHRDNSKAIAKGCTMTPKEFTVLLEQ